jgi:hypothetical protein
MDKVPTPHLVDAWPVPAILAYPSVERDFVDVMFPADFPNRLTSIRLPDNAPTAVAGVLAFFHRR